MLKFLRAAFAPTPTPTRKRQARMFAGAGFDRKTSDWIAQSTSGDSEIRTSLRTLRNRSRQLVRDNDFAKNAIRVVKNNVVGSGIGLQAQVKKRRGDKLDTATNDAIEAAWQAWCRPGNCEVSGRYSFAEICRQAIGAMAESGEVLIRVHRFPFGKSRVPYALEILEADQLVDEQNGREGAAGNEIRMGVEVDQYQRPVAYWLYPRHPGDFQFVPGQIQTNRLIRVPAADVFHLYIPNRPGETRGVPWLASSMLRLNHLGGYEEAELIAARSSAAIMGFIQRPEVADPTVAADGADALQDGDRVFDMEPGLIKELAPGESFTGFNPQRPNTGLDPFMRAMLRGVCAGIGMSYEAISKDYSQANYSSSRLALLDDRDQWRVLQTWFCDHFLQPLFEDWMTHAAIQALPANLVDPYLAQPERYTAVRWKVRGWDWVDPWKEVQAARLAVRCGLQTNQTILAAQGQDYEDVFRQLHEERQMAADLDLILETDPAKTDDKGAAQSAAPDETPAPAGAQPVGANDE